jgi:hypothetical protein
MAGGWAATVEAPGLAELALLCRGRDLLAAGLDLVLVDTSSVHLYRDGESELVRPSAASWPRPLRGSDRSRCDRWLQP